MFRNRTSLLTIYLRLWITGNNVANNVQFITHSLLIVSLHETSIYQEPQVLFLCSLTLLVIVKNGQHFNLLWVKLWLEELISYVTLPLEWTRSLLKQWWSVTSCTSLLCLIIFSKVSVLYWSSFILSNFYFYFTTFQSIRSKFLLHYIRKINNKKITWIKKDVTPYNTSRAPRRRWGVWFMNKCIIFNEPVKSVRKSHQKSNSRFGMVLESTTHWFKLSV